MFPYGAQYFREPNPPKSEWEKDFQRIAEADFNIVKIWAMWSWIHIGEGKYDFDNFDRMFELAEKNGVKLLINTILENAPYWLARKHPEALYHSSTGKRFELIARSNTPGGAWPGLCWDNAPTRGLAAEFLKAVGERYRNSPALWGYDVWNEVFFEPYGYPNFIGEQFCYCDSSKREFVNWLKKRYGNIDGLCAAWRRRHTSWDEVYPPPYQGTYPDWMDWLHFRIERMREQLRWRVSTLRSVDPEHPMTSHGVAFFGHMATMLSNDLDVAGEVDQWGISSFPAWAKSGAADHMWLLDITRSAAQKAGKKFWQTELQGGHAVGGMYRSYIPRATDTAFWNWTAFMCGADGMLYWQWRPELLGPESPGFGLCRLDGSPSDRTEAASWFARFMNEHEDLSRAPAVKGDVAILCLPESQLFNYVMQFDASAYEADVHGIYLALWEQNITVDFIRIDSISEYPLVYLPFPLCIEKQHAQALKDYVANGGALISHACPGHFDDNAYCSFTIPGLGLGEVFGAVEDETEFVQSLIDAGRPTPEVIWNGQKLPCSIYQEKLIASGGNVKANYSDGSAAIIENTFGKGKTRLIGTFPGHAYWTTKDNCAAAIIQSGVECAGIEPALKISNPDIKARLRVSDEAVFLWTLNSASEERIAEITIAPRFGEFSSATDVKTGSSIAISGPTLTVRLAPRSGSVAKLYRR